MPRQGVALHVGDDGDPGGRLRDESIGCQASESRAQGSPAHAQAGGLLDFAEHGARREDAGLDLFEEGSVGPIAGAHAGLLDIAVHR